MTKNNRFSPASEKGHLDGLVDESEYLRQSSLYKQILPRPVRNSGSFVALAKKDSEGGTPSRLKTICVNLVNLVKKTSCLSVFVAKTQRNMRNPRLINDLRLFNVLYCCREIFTDVMSALQIHLFMQNKAKFKKSQVNVTGLLKMNYEQMDTWSIRKKQSQTNPNEPKRTQLKPIKCQNKPNSNPIYPVVASGEAGTNPISEENNA